MRTEVAIFATRAFHAQLDIEIKDRFGNPVKPREVLVVSLFAVNEDVDRIKDATIIQ